MSLTWDEFKQLVDRRLAAQGFDGSVKVWIVDATYPAPDTGTANEHVYVQVTASNELEVTTSW